MAIARVISWILGNGIYAYVYMPDGHPQIGNKILENSPLWVDIVKEVGTWSEEKYKEAYNNLSNIVSGKGYTLPPYDNRFFDGGIELEGYKLALLSGVGGIGGGSGSGVGPSDGADEGIDSSEYEKFIEELEKELEKAREELEKKTQEINQSINSAFSETYHNAKQEIEETRNIIGQMRDDLEEKLKGAKDALDKAKEALGDGKIDPNEMEEIFRSVKEYSEWMNTYSNVIASLKSEYDEVNGQIGSIGEAEDASAGLFAKFASCINVLSGTAGNVHSWMVASSATIGQMASWYDENANSATEVIRYMSASAGQITDTINYIYGEGEDSITSILERKMDAKDASIKDTIMHATDTSIINVSRELDALRANITDKISYLASNGDLVSMGEQMNAMDFEMKQWMTKVNNLSGTAIDMREEWSEASGKLSTIANLMAETDANGNILFFTSGGTMGEDNWWEKSVIKVGEDKWTDTETQTLTFRTNQVYAKYSAVMYSWFQQQADRIEMGIQDELKDLKASISMGFINDESFINMVATKVVIDAEMIANAISAKTANIGGIVIGNGVVQSTLTKNGNPLFKLNGSNGQVYAQNLKVNGDAELYGNINIAGNAKIDGSITATSLTLGENYGYKDIDIKDYIDKQIPSDLTSSSDVERILNDYISSSAFQESITSGYVTKEDLMEWAENNPNLTSGDVKILIDSIIDAEINFTETDVDEYGKVYHTAKIGNKEYTWNTIKGKDYLLLGHEYGSGMNFVDSANTPSFLISTDGLLTANNAVIYGKIFASEGYFQGKVEADSGYFRGSISADSGYFKGTISADSGCFKGEIVADRLTLSSNYGGDKDIDIKDYIDEQMPVDFTSSADVKQMINDYVSSSAFQESITSGYITKEDLMEWAENNPNLTSGDVKNLIDQYGNTEINTSFSSITEDGKTKYTINIGDKTYEWYTFESTDIDGDDFVMLDRPYPSENELSASGASGTTSVLISKDGLLQAYNTIIHGFIYAQGGEIGGFRLANTMLEVTDSGNYDKTIAFLNGSTTYKDDEKGKLILAAGIADNITFYKYELVSGSSSSPQYIYTMNPYGNANKTKSGEVLDVYLSNDNIHIYESDIPFYYRKVFLRINPTLTPDSGNTGGSGDDSGSGDNGGDDSGSGDNGIDYNKPWIPGFKDDDKQTLTKESQDIILGSQVEEDADRSELDDLIITDYADYVLFCEDLPVKQDNGGGILALSAYFQEFITNSNGDIYMIPQYILTQDFSDISVKTNTRIYEDGSIFTKSLITQDGYFKGEINADGVFRGELNNATGTLSGIKMTDTTLSGQIILENNNCFTAKNGSTDNYLEISTNSLPKEGGISNYTLSNVSWAQQNKNGANEGKFYDVRKELISCSFKSGATITIPDIKGELWRYTPSNRSCKNSTITLIVTFDGGGITVPPQTKTLDGFEGSDSKINNFTFTGGTYTATSNGRVTIYLRGDIHLSDKSWLGLDKASGSLSVAATSNLKVSVPVPDSGMYISPEGFAIYTKGGQLVCNDTGIKITNKDGKYGIEISNDSINKIMNGMLSPLK